MIPALAWLLSGAVLLGPDPAGSRVAAAALPWLALAGIPRRRPRPCPWGGAARAAALAAPVLGLALALDRQDGVGWGRGLLEVGAVLVLVAGLAVAAEREADGPVRRRAPRELAWLVLVPVLPLAAAVVGWNDAPGGAPAWLERAALASPLRWAFHRAAPGAAAPWHDVLLPLAAVLLLAGLPRGASR